MTRIARRAARHDGLEIAVAVYIDWFNWTRLHGWCGDRPLLRVGAALRGCPGLPGDRRGTAPHSLLDPAWFTQSVRGRRPRRAPFRSEGHV